MNSSALLQLEPSDGIAMRLGCERQWIIGEQKY